MQNCALIGKCLANKNQNYFSVDLMTRQHTADSLKKISIEFDGTGLSGFCVVGRLVFFEKRTSAVKKKNYLVFKRDNSIKTDNMLDF